MSVPIAIIGTGIAGLSAAHALRSAGQTVQLFDKGHGSGGRMASKRSEAGTLDLGAQYFTARDRRFLDALQHWREEGWVDEWKPALYQYRDGQLSPSPDEQPRWVGIPRMSAITRALLTDLQVVFSCRITEVFRGKQHWHLQDAEGQNHGPFNQVLIAIPLPGHAAAGQRAETGGHRRERGHGADLGGGAGLPRGTRHPGAGLLRARQSDRLAGLQSQQAGARHRPRHLGAARHQPVEPAAHRHGQEDVIEHLRCAFAEVIGCAVPEAAFSIAHRWLYAPGGGSPVGRPRRSRPGHLRLRRLVLQRPRRRRLAQRPGSRAAPAGTSLRDRAVAWRPDVTRKYLYKYIDLYKISSRMCRMTAWLSSCARTSFPSGDDTDARISPPFPVAPTRHQRLPARRTGALQRRPQAIRALRGTGATRRIRLLLPGTGHRPGHAAPGDSPGRHSGSRRGAEPRRPGGRRSARRICAASGATGGCAGRVHLHATFAVLRAATGQGLP